MRERQPSSKSSVLSSQKLERRLKKNAQKVGDFVESLLDKEATIIGYSSSEIFDNESEKEVSMKNVGSNQTLVQSKSKSKPSHSQQSFQHATRVQRNPVAPHRRSKGTHRPSSIPIRPGRIMRAVKPHDRQHPFQSPSAASLLTINESRDGTGISGFQSPTLTDASYTQPQGFIDRVDSEGSYIEQHMLTGPMSSSQSIQAAFPLLKPRNLQGQNSIQRPHTLPAGLSLDSGTSTESPLMSRAHTDASPVGSVSSVSRMGQLPDVLASARRLRGEMNSRYAFGAGPVEEQQSEPSEAQLNSEMEALSAKMDAITENRFYLDVGHTIQRVNNVLRKLDTPAWMLNPSGDGDPEEEEIDDDDNSTLMTPRLSEQPTRKSETFASVVKKTRLVTVTFNDPKESRDRKAMIESLQNASKSLKMTRDQHQTELQDLVNWSQGRCARFDADMAGLKKIEEQGHVQLMEFNDKSRLLRSELRAMEKKQTNDTSETKKKIQIKTSTLLKNLEKNLVRKQKERADQEYAMTEAFAEEMRKKDRELLRLRGELDFVQKKILKSADSESTTSIAMLVEWHNKRTEHLQHMIQHQARTFHQLGYEANVDWEAIAFRLEDYVSLLVEDCGGDVALAEKTLRTRFQMLMMESRSRTPSLMIEDSRAAVREAKKKNQDMAAEVTRLGKLVKKLEKEINKKEREIQLLLDEYPWLSSKQDQTSFGKALGESDSQDSLPPLLLDDHYLTSPRKRALAGTIAVMTTIKAQVPDASEKIEEIRDLWEHGVILDQETQLHARDAVLHSTFGVLHNHWVDCDRMRYGIEVGVPVEQAIADNPRVWRNLTTPSSQVSDGDDGPLLVHMAHAVELAWEGYQRMSVANAIFWLLEEAPSQGLHIDARAKDAVIKWMKSGESTLDVVGDWLENLVKLAAVACAVKYLRAQHVDVDSSTMRLMKTIIKEGGNIPSAILQKVQIVSALSVLESSALSSTSEAAKNAMKMIRQCLATGKILSPEESSQVSAAVTTAQLSDEYDSQHMYAKAIVTALRAAKIIKSRSTTAMGSRRESPTKFNRHESPIKMFNGPMKKKNINRNADNPKETGRTDLSRDSRRAESILNGTQALGVEYPRQQDLINLGKHALERESLQVQGLESNWKNLLQDLSLSQSKLITGECMQAEKKFSALNDMRDNVERVYSGLVQSETPLSPGDDEALAEDLTRLCAEFMELNPNGIELLNRQLDGALNRFLPGHLHPNLLKRTPSKLSATPIEHDSEHPATEEDVAKAKEEFLKCDSLFWEMWKVKKHVNDTVKKKVEDLENLYDSMTKEYRTMFGSSGRILTQDQLLKNAQNDVREKRELIREYESKLMQIRQKRGSWQSWTMDTIFMSKEHKAESNEHCQRLRDEARPLRVKLAQLRRNYAKARKLLPRADTFASLGTQYAAKRRLHMHTVRSQRQQIQYSSSLPSVVLQTSLQSLALGRFSSVLQKYRSGKENRPRSPHFNFALEQLQKQIAKTRKLNSSWGSLSSSRSILSQGYLKKDPSASLSPRMRWQKAMSKMAEERRSKQQPSPELPKKYVKPTTFQIQGMDRSDQGISDDKREELALDKHTEGKTTHRDKPEKRHTPGVQLASILKREALKPNPKSKQSDNERTQKEDPFFVDGSPFPCISPPPDLSGSSSPAESRSPSAVPSKTATLSHLSHSAKHRQQKTTTTVENARKFRAAALALRFSRISQRPVIGSVSSQLKGKLNSAHPETKLPGFDNVGLL